MTAQQHFWDLMYAWSLACGFILTIIIIVIIAVGVDTGDIKNPFAPFIRAFESWQKHHQEMARLKVRAQIAKAGGDPDYVEYLERKGLR
jgi:thiosulfate reductase cytochrome b subunit